MITHPCGRQFVLKTSFQTSLGVLLAIYLSGCGSKAQPTGHGDEEAGWVVSITASKAVLAAASSANVVVSGDGFGPITQELAFSESEVYGVVQGVPSGSGRTFTVSLYDDDGVPLYVGSAVVDLPLGEGEAVELTLRAVNSMYRRRITLPATTHYGIGQFHGSLHADHDIIVVGDTQADGGGEAYLWSESGEVLHQFRAPRPRNGDGFGSAALILDGIVALGAKDDDVLGEIDAGAVYVFDLGSGALVAELVGDVTASGQFGHSLAYADGRLLIGAPGEPPNGMVYVFDGDRNSSTYLERVAKIEGFAYLGGDGSRFGGEIAVGSTIAIGDAFFDEGAINAGAVHLYDVGSLSFERTIVNPVPLSADGFGERLDMDGDVLAIGAVGVDGSSEDEGAVFLYDSIGGHITTLHSPNPNQGDRFGSSVALSSVHLLVGGGGAHLFDRETGHLITRFETPFPQEDNAFGFSVGFLDEDPIVASRIAVYVFEFVEPVSMGVEVVGSVLDENVSAEVTGTVAPDSVSVSVTGSIEGEGGAATVLGTIASEGAGADVTGVVVGDSASVSVTGGIEDE